MALRLQVCISGKPLVSMVQLLNKPLYKFSTAIQPNICLSLIKCKFYLLLQKTQDDLTSEFPNHWPTAVSRYISTYVKHHCVPFIVCETYICFLSQILLY